MTIEVHAGSMFSDKSSELIRRIRHHEVSNQKLGVDYLAFNHSSDTRYGLSVIANHDGESFPCFTLTNSMDLLEFVFDIDPNNQDNPFTIKKNLVHIRGLYFDEAQFFDPALPEVLTTINMAYLTHPDRRESLPIIVTGLDLDFRGEPFDPVPNLMAKADKVVKHKAVCIPCGKSNATRTQRIIDGKPAHYTDPIIFVGASEAYTARCPRHHEVPGKPQIKFQKD